MSFVGCGGDTESSTSPVDEITSSTSNEVVESSDGSALLLTSSSESESSSSEKAVDGSSSSDGKASSSSGKVESSSSGKGEKSSSSEGAAGSSSAKVEESSSSAKVDESSSSMKAAESSSSVKVEESSSSEKNEISSSSEKPVESSSSEKVEETSSSVKPDESSSSIFGSSSSAVENSSSSLEVSGVCKTELEDYCTYGSLYDERDGQTYKTVKIDEQWWMAENLRYKDVEQSTCYKEDSENCRIYGRLYKRNGALNDCPTGWHLPTQQEWYSLRKYVLKNSGRTYAGRELRADTLWDTSKLGVGYDSFGFSALPGGAYDANDGWWGMSKHAVFWLSDVYKAGTINCYTFSQIRYNEDTGGSYSDGSDLSIGRSSGICEQYPASKYSVRCIKD